MQQCRRWDNLMVCLTNGRPLFWPDFISSFNYHSRPHPPVRVPLKNKWFIVICLIDEGRLITGGESNLNTPGPSERRVCNEINLLSALIHILARHTHTHVQEWVCSVVITCVIMLFSYSFCADIYFQCLLNHWPQICYHPRRPVSHHKIQRDVLTQTL